MAFVTIKRDEDIASVSMGAFKEIFSRAGWKIIDSKKKEKKEDKSEEQSWDEIDSEDDEMKSLLEKPISELTNEEVKSLAFYKGIEVEGKSIKQLKELIKRNS